jgi:hypothetical protein
MVRHDGPWTYFVVDVDTDAILAGPFALSRYAFGCAHSIACKRGGGVLERLHHDLASLAANLHDTQVRVDELADACRRGLEELGKRR